MNLPPISMHILVKNFLLLSTKSYREEFITLACMHTRGEKMTATQKDQLVSYSWAIAYKLDPSCL